MAAVWDDGVGREAAACACRKVVAQIAADGIAKHIRAARWFNLRERSTSAMMIALCTGYGWHRKLRLLDRCMLTGILTRTGALS